MGTRLQDKVVLVTGGGGGIGEATARLCWEEGAFVTLVDNDDAAVRTAAQAIDPAGARTLALVADIRQESEAERVVSAAVARFGGLHVLVNVAGVRVYGPITEATPESWEFVIGVNLLGMAYCSKFAVPAIERSGGGSIVQVSSVHAVVGRPGMPQYDATKGAVLALTRSMACDHAAQGIRVNAVCPGSTLTPFHIQRRASDRGISLAEAEAELRAEGVPTALIKRKAEPREVAYSIVFLASDEASYITGATLMVDGGVSV